MDRDELARAAAMALLDHDAAPVLAGGMNYSANFNAYWARAVAVLDAILPQVTTVEELEALPLGAVLAAADGSAWNKYRPRRSLRMASAWRDTTGWYGLGSEALLARMAATHGSPLTVVWRPS